MPYEIVLYRSTSLFVEKIWGREESARPLNGPTLTIYAILVMNFFN